MEVSSPCNGGTSELFVRRLGSKKIYASHNQRGHRLNSDTEESLISKFGNALRAFLHVKENQHQFSDCNSLPSKDYQLQYSDCNILPSKDAPMQSTLPAEFNHDQPKLSTPPPIEDALNKHGDVPCAEYTPLATPLTILSESPPLVTPLTILSESAPLVTPLTILSESVPSMVVSVDAEEENSDDVSRVPIDEQSEGLVCEHQPSPPVAVEPTKKLISAIKGTRHKLGIAPLTKLTVTWSPDVYDPPVTSVTHTVTGRNRHHRRSRNKKTNTTSKRHKGGKSSQGSSSSGKQYQKHSSKSDHHHRSNASSSSSSSSSSPPSSSSSPTSISERSVFSGYESTLDFLDFDSTCGSSFLGKSVVEVLSPFAEAK